MRKIIFFILILFTCCLSQQLNAQSWNRGTKAFSFGVGGTVFRHINNDYYGFSFWRTLGLLSVQGEFAVHEYVGVGFITGLGFAGSSFRYHNEIAIPLGVVGNFHFWQLIEKNSGKDLRGDKLDLYVGLSLGSGFATFFGEGENYNFALLFIGPHVGVRYYFTDNIGVMGEFGYGKSWINAGVVIKTGN